MNVRKFSQIPGAKSLIRAFAEQESPAIKRIPCTWKASIVLMGGTGSKGGTGGKGGKGGKEGDGDKAKRALETPAQKAARLESMRGKWGGKAKRVHETPEQKAARCEARNEKNNTALSVQQATHRLNRIIHGTDEVAESAMVDKKSELDLFYGALVKRSGVLAQQGKTVAVQTQYTQIGLAAIMAETDKTTMRQLLKGVARECALVQLFQIRLTNMDPVSAYRAHELETHAQRCLMQLTSYDPHSNVIQLYNASALPADGWSMLTNGDILAKGDRAMVTTVTVFKGNPGVAAQPSQARNDSVFGPNRFKVCWMECTCMQMRCDQLMQPVWFSTETDILGPGNTCHGDSQHHPSGPSRPPRSPPVH